MQGRITYSTGTDELRASTTYMTRKGSVLRRAARRGPRRMLLLTFGLFAVVLVAIFATTPPPEQRPPRHESPAILLLPIGIIGAFLVFALILARAAKGSYWRYLRAHGRIDDQYGPTELVLTDEGPRFDYRALTVLYKWSGIAGIDEDESYLYVAVGPTQGVAIPKAAFATPADAALFRDAMRGKVRPNLGAG